jgi:hypothetical protein
MVINGAGAVATGVALGIILVSKFMEGAWITALLIPSLLALMCGIRRHYDYIERDTAPHALAKLNGMPTPIAVVPIDRWSRVAEKALRFASAISHEVWVLHIATEEDRGNGNFRKIWNEYVEKPAKTAGLKTPRLAILQSPYRLVVKSIYEYVLQRERRNQGRDVVVLVPELVERRWFYYVLHGQRATALKLILYLKGDHRITVITVPWYVSS